MTTDPHDQEAPMLSDAQQEWDEDREKGVTILGDLLAWSEGSRTGFLTKLERRWLNDWRDQLINLKISSDQDLTPQREHDD